MVATATLPEVNITCKEAQCCSAALVASLNLHLKATLQEAAAVSLRHIARMVNRDV